MGGKRRRPLPVKRLVALLVALVAVALTVVTVSASATTSTASARSEPGVTRATGTPVGGSKVRSSFTVTDTGRAIVISGSARNMPAYAVSLIYPVPNCSAAEPVSPSTLDGSWQNHGDGSQTLFAVYDGAAYRAVKGRIGSVSVREVTSVAPIAGSTDFAARFAARSCATLTPTR